MTSETVDPENTSGTVDPDNARQAEKTGHVRYMLIGGLVGAVAALIIVGLFV